MSLDPRKFGIILISSTILLSGCLQNQNGEATPPERDPGIEEPGDSGGETPVEDPVTEDPVTEDPGAGDTPSDGEVSMPLANGTKLFGLKDSDVGSPNVIRVARNINGSSITYDVEKQTSSGGSWASYTDYLPFYILGDNGTGQSFIQMKPENYQLDTSSYSLSLDAITTTFNISHTSYNASGQTIQDFVDTNMGLSTLGQFLSPTVEFDSSAYIYKEVLTNPEDIVVYFPGNYAGDNCKLANSDTSLSETLTETSNCNLVVDGSLNPVTTTADATNADLAAAPSLRLSALIDEAFKLKSHGISQTDDSGDVHLASDPDPDNNIGYYQTVTNSNGSYFEVVFNNLADQTFFVEEDLPWSGITKLVMVEDAGFVRIGAVIPATSKWDANQYLLNDSALNQLLNSITW